MTVTGSVASIESVDADNSYGDVVVYTTMGREVRRYHGYRSQAAHGLPDGIYIVSANGVRSKIYVKN